MMAIYQVNENKKHSQLPRFPNGVGRHLVHWFAISDVGWQMTVPI